MLDFAPRNPGFYAANYGDFKSDLAERGKGWLVFSTFDWLEFWRRSEKPIFESRKII